jgi:hypothetical protein
VLGGAQSAWAITSQFAAKFSSSISTFSWMDLNYCALPKHIVTWQESRNSSTSVSLLSLSYFEAVWLLFCSATSYYLWSQVASWLQYLPSAMAKGKLIPVEVQWIVVHMVPLVDLEHISAWTDVSRSQILKILALHRQTGSVERGIDRQGWGHNRHLTADDIAARTSNSISSVGSTVSAWLPW